MDIEGLKEQIFDYIDTVDDIDKDCILKDEEGREHVKQIEELNNQDIIDNKYMEIEDTIGNFIDNVNEIYDEDGIEQIKKDIFPFSFIIQSDNKEHSLKVFLKLENSIIEKTKLLKPGMIYSDFEINISLDEEELKKDMDKEEFIEFIDYLENNINRIIDIDNIIKKLHDDYNK